MQFCCLYNKEQHARLETRKRRRVDDAYVVDAVEDGRDFETGAHIPVFAIQHHHCI